MLPVPSAMRSPRRLRGKQPPAASGPSARRRLTTKQAPPDRSSLFRSAVLAQAQALECADDTLQPLGPKVRRNHAHYTHVRTTNPSHRQPESFTRAEFYEHMERCYRIVYPDPQSLTGIRNARRAIDATQLAEERGMTLMDKLRRASAQLTCECGGTWCAGVAQILLINIIDKHVFAKAMVRALEMGAKRGTNIGLVGRAGSGKSTLIESLEKVCTTAGKPQQNSSFPWSNAAQCDILLWQDYKHHEQTVSFTDLLSFLVGESVDVRVPGEKNVKVRNVAPMIYSGRAPLPSSFSEPSGRLEYDEMMMERFTTFRFTHPIDKHTRRPDYAQCGKCCAHFYLSNGAP